MNDLNPTQAHDIVNKEINVILKEFMEYPEDDVVRAEIKIIISMEETEIEFLRTVEYNDKYLDKRFQALKISMADLKEKLK